MRRPKDTLCLNPEKGHFNIRFRFDTVVTTDVTYNRSQTHTFLKDQRLHQKHPLKCWRCSGHEGRVCGLYETVSTNFCRCTQTLTTGWCTRGLNSPSSDVGSSLGPRNPGFKGVGTSPIGAHFYGFRPTGAASERTCTQGSTETTSRRLGSRGDSPLQDPTWSPGISRLQFLLGPQTPGRFRTAIGNTYFSGRPD